ncbi:MAG: uncharacterized protein QOG62_571 [Thermoleophilaceae bacterium]|jgi:ketosteroid isomerase-like protein|nr:uncharacterized protein [Thermoleophilaceae bacterium]
MSQENVEIVRRIYEGWSRGDFSAGIDHFDPDIEFSMQFGVDGGEGRGAAALASAWQENLRNWQDWRTGEIDELIESGDSVVVIGPIRGRGKHSEAEVEIPDAACAFTFRNGRIVKIVPTDSRQKALDAVGLSE